MTWNNWDAWQGIGTVAAVVVALGLQGLSEWHRRTDNDHRERDRVRDDETRRRGQQRSLYIDLTLRIAEDYEAWCAQHAAAFERTFRLKACLAALPVAYLQILRHEFGVMPDGRHVGRITSYGDHKQEKARDEIIALLYNLTGSGTDQDYETLDSPTAKRERGPIIYP